MQNTFPMISDLKVIENSALSLNLKDKARLTDILLQSIQCKIDPEIEQVWIDEVQKRKESLKSDEVTLHFVSEVLIEARKRVQK